MKKLAIVLAFLVLGLHTGPAFAEDEGLYDPVAPEGSAFVRFINLDSNGKSLPAIINGKTHKNTGFEDVGSYYPVPSGEAELKMGKATVSANLEKAAFYTAVLQQDKLDVIKDQVSASPLKAIVAFYNFSGEALSLKTADGKVEVVPPVESGKSGYRELNAVDVTLALYKGEQKAADVPPVSLKRRGAVAVIALQKAGKTEAKAVQARTDTRQ